MADGVQAIEQAHRGARGRVGELHAAVDFLRLGDDVAALVLDVPPLDELATDRLARAWVGDGQRRLGELQLADGDG